MEGNESTQYNFRIDSGIPHSFLSKTSTNLPRPCQRPVPYACLGRYVQDNSKHEITRCPKKCTPVTKLHFPSISGAEARRVGQTYIQSESSKRVCANRTISFDKHASHPRLPPAAGLAVQDRYITSLFSSESRKVPQALSSPYIQRTVVGNDLSSVWFEHGSKNIFNVDKLGGSNLTRKMEYKNPSLLGRPLDCPPKCKHIARARQPHGANVAVPRVACEFQKICTLPSKEHCLPGNNVEHLGKSKELARGKSFNSQKTNKSRSRANENYSERLAKNNRVSEFRQFCHPQGSTQPSALNKVSEFTTRKVSTILPFTTEGCRRTEMVGPELPTTNRNTLSPPGAFFDNGCIGPSMGSTAKQSSYIGRLDSNRGSIALQHERNVGNTTRNSGPDPHSSPEFSFNTMRQSDCSSTSAEGRRYEVITSVGNDLSNSEFTGSSSNSLQNTSHTGQVQQPCRPLVSQSQTSRMAFTPTRLRGSICEVGMSSDRSVRIEDSTCGQQLRVVRPDRPPSPVSRCIQCSMELPTCMGLSTAVPDTQSSDPSKSIDGNVPDGRSSVEKGILASGPQSPSHRSTINLEAPSETSGRHVNRPATTESGGNRFRGLEMWGWSDAVETWNTEQLSLLKNSWRKSTLKTYEVAWNRWCSWATSKGLNIKSPTGPQLAQFLCDLYLTHNLSYNTILLHKSVVSTLCSAEMSGQLSNHVIVKHILKSIALKNPKSTKPPVWDVSVLINFLIKYKVDINNIFQISRHTAILLLLCSGRRIHDLTLLRTDPSHCHKTSESITFWPQFGSKTDSSTYRQSGWKLLVNANNHNLNPVYWIERTMLLLNERREASKSFNLFITVRGAPVPASRTVIAGWVKTLFKDAGIAATPGSVRSAVASKSWLENHPLDDILARGNWQSANTFQKFYRREIIPNVDSESVTQLFNPIN